MLKTKTIFISGMMTVLLTVSSLITLSAQRRNHQPRVRIKSQSVTDKRQTDFVEIDRNKVVPVILQEQFFSYTKNQEKWVDVSKTDLGLIKKNTPSNPKVKGVKQGEKWFPEKTVFIKSEKLGNEFPRTTGVKKTQGFMDVMWMIFLGVGSVFAIAATVFIILVTAGGLGGVYVSLMYAFIGTSLFGFLMAMIFCFIILFTS